MKKLLTILLLIVACIAPADARRTSKNVKQQKQQTEKRIRETDAKIKEKNRQITRSLTDLNRLAVEIEDCNAAIGELRGRIDSLGTEITIVNDSIKRLDQRLALMRQSFAAALKSARQSRSSMSNLAFLFSSDSFSQAYRRSRALKQFSKWRDRKAVEISQVKDLLSDRREHLDSLKSESSRAMNQLKQHKTELTDKQTATDRIVTQLKGERKRLDGVLKEQREKAAQLDSELDRIIAQEQREAEEKARREAEEKARKEAEEKARREAEEQARKEAEEKARLEAERIKAEEEAERARREAEMTKAEREKAEKAAKEKAAKEKAEREKAEKAAKEKAAKDKVAKEKAEKEAKEKAKKGKGDDKQGGENKPSTPAADPGTGSSTPSPANIATPKPVDFASLKGLLPYPVEGSYSIAKRFGRQKHPKLPYVETNNSGIDLLTSPGAVVKAVSDGEVSAIICPDGYNNVVVVRHGNYATVYANLGSLKVRKGDKVKANQALGTVYIDPADNNRSILHFEIRNATNSQNIIKENPESWLK